MNMYNTTLQESNDDIAQLVAHNHRLSKNDIFPFADNRELLTELFTQHDFDSVNLVSIGTATPDLSIAADKANMSITEFVGKNPFSYNLNYTLENITDGDIVYIANPNKITGANFSLTGLTKIIEKNANGLTIIDEYYFDFFGITALSLIEKFNNVVVIRSFTAAFGIYSSDAGYAVSSKNIIARCKEMVSQKRISTIMRKTILATMSNVDALKDRLHDIHEESLRLTKELTNLGLQCRITATDFLLLRVASPKDVGNFLYQNKVDIENLCGYPKMKNYIRFRIESFFSNERFISAFQKMPENFYKMSSAEKHSMTINRPDTKPMDSHSLVTDLLDGKVKERSKTPDKIVEKQTSLVAD